ncbi:ABC transporter permease [Paenibacillus puldeungensis]|uniref:ABC transporter permease n=1 Tax=Paenibacillus puldeungensis TaxID=696536 RepID=A0ABW3S4E2_9BACL
MFKLIKLEWKKNKISKYIRNAIILSTILGLFLFAQCFLGIANDPDTGVPDAAAGTNNISSQVEILSSASFLVFTGVMLASFIINAYKNKTMNLMFSYPIKRQKILLSKMLAVWIFNFVALVITKILIYGVLYMTSGFLKSDFPVDYNMADPSFYLQIVLKSFVTISIGFIALFIGKIMKSSKVTVISSFLLFILLNGTIGDFTLANNAIFPLILAAVSALSAILFIVGVETRDVV